MSQLQESLKELELSDTESAIYLSGLGYSSVGVNELVRQTRLKRTTVYHALETLHGKGLVTKKTVAGKLVFAMARPEHLERFIDKKMAALEEQKHALAAILPLLNQKTARAESGARVVHYEGIDGMKRVVEEALYSKSGRWDIIAPPKNFFSEWSREYSTYFLETRKRRGIIARSLWESTENRRVLTTEELRARNPRILPPAMRGKFKSVVIIFDDKVALISSLKERSAILIQSPEVHDTFAALFEGLWSVSGPYPQN